MRQIGSAETAGGGGATGRRERRMTTLLELATAFSDAVQDEALAARLLVEVIRSGAVRTARGRTVEISPERLPGAYDPGGGREGGSARDSQGGRA